MSGNVASAYGLHASKCQIVCVCASVCVCMCIIFLFLQRKPNYVSSRHKLFPVGMMKLCLACCLVKSMWKMGKGGRDNLGHGECNPSFFQMLETKSALKNHKTQAQCVVSSPTPHPLLIRLLEGEQKTVRTEKHLCFCLTMRQSQDCSSCGVYKDMSTTAQ